MAKADEKKVEEKKPNGDDTGIIQQDDPTLDAGGEDGADDQAVKEAADAFKRQIEELKRSEKEQREARQQAEADRAKALQLAQEREAQLSQHQVSAAQSRFEAITSAMAAATASAESAQRDIEVAINNGDAAAQADAYRRLSRAEADLSRLEEGKTAAEQEIAQEKANAQRVAQQARAAAEAAANDPLAKANIPEPAKDWLRKHPEYLSDQRKNAKLQAVHWDALDEGHAAFSPEYFDAVERHLGLKAAAKVERVDDDDDKGGSFVSAPVTRQVPGGAPPKPTAATLTKAEREAAKLAGITEVEYAKQKQALLEAKAAGHYNN